MLKLLAAVLIGTPMLLLIKLWKPVAVRDRAPDPRFCVACCSVQSPLWAYRLGFTAAIVELLTLWSFAVTWRKLLRRAQPINHRVERH